MTAGIALVFEQTLRNGTKTVFANGVERWKTEEWTILSQNKNKPGSRFAKLAQKGYDVKWLVSKDNNWYLFVNGIPTPKESVVEIAGDVTLKE